MYSECQFESRFEILRIFFYYYDNECDAQLLVFDIQIHDLKDLFNLFWGYSFSVDLITQNSASNEIPFHTWLSIDNHQ